MYISSLLRADMDTLDLQNPWWKEGCIGEALAPEFHRSAFDEAKNLFELRQIVVITGLRRVGKSTIMYQLIEDQLNSNTDPKHILYFTFDEAVEGLVEVLVSSSSAGSPLAFQAGGASSQTGVLYFNGTAYGTTDKLCKTGATTFFAIHTGSGVLSTGGNGRAWIDGQWTSSLAVQPGWHEVMFAGASSCTVTEPDGQVVVYPSGTVSTVPLIGTLPSSRFELYVPTGGSAGPFLMVFDGSYDRIA
jgi:GTPase SAR1 family protein